MTPPPLTSQQQVFPEIPAIVRNWNRDDLQWNRPVFRAPPLDVKPKLPELSAQFDAWIRTRDVFWR